MATLDDIIAQKKAATAILDDKIMDGITAQNAESDPARKAQLAQAVQTLTDQRQTVALQAYQGALGSDEMAQALAALSAATKDMSAAASVMTDATSFLSNLAALTTAAGKVATALKGA